MIAKLTGVVDSIRDVGVVLDVSGIGFFVYASTKDIAKMPVGAKVSLKIVHIFKQEQQLLCGFLNSEDIAIFESLLSVQGIGVKSALGVLSTLSHEELALAIAHQEANALCKVVGIGKKTAERILLELKDKTLVKITDISEVNNVTNDAILALISLGYQKHNVIQVVQKIMQNSDKNISTDEIIIRCLQELA